MDKVIAWEQRKIEGTVILPASKSESNRALVLSALAGGGVPKNLSDSDDTRVLAEALKQAGGLVDVGHSGTSMRFLAAYFALREGVWELTGSERMKQRPIKVLVEALRELGANIEYLGREGFPPLWISNSMLTGGRAISLDASVSSQYISALMMIAPLLKGGLVIDLRGKIASADYIRMTAEMMRRFGVSAAFEGKRVTIPEGVYMPVTFWVSADWSAASFFYELLAIAGEGEISLPGLDTDSLQGDACQVDLWRQLGVITEKVAGGVRLSAHGERIARFEADLSGMPDVALPLIVACCLSDTPFHLRGLDTLYIKECDRVMAVTRETGKLGYVLQVPAHGELCWNRERNTLIALDIDTYQDHRMAMAFAPAGLKYPGLTVRDAGVVTKSFPDFWEQLDHLVISLILD